MPRLRLILAAALVAATPAFAAESPAPPAPAVPAAGPAVAPAPSPGAAPGSAATPPSAGAPPPPAGSAAQAAAPSPTQLAAIGAAPVLPEVVPPPAAKGPKIIDVAPADGAGIDEEDDDRPGHAHHRADRDQLLREFPDDFVERMWIQDWQDLERAYQHGRLIDVPSDPEGRGIRLRLGDSGIGELEDDPYRQMMLCRLSRPAAGLLYRIAARMRLMEGEAYEPLDITSLVRTWHYQLKLTDVNPNADRTKDGVPPTHVLGLAFDIARSRMSEERQERLEFLLDQLAAAGELAYYKEGSRNGLKHYHVMALPSAETLLVRDFERTTRDADTRVAAAGRHRAAPDAPCVAFDTALQPLSAICSCELPVEVSAATSSADFPVAR